MGKSINHSSSPTPTPSLPPPPYPPCLPSFSFNLPIQSHPCHIFWMTVFDGTPPPPAAKIQSSSFNLSTNASNGKMNSYSLKLRHFVDCKTPQAVRLLCWQLLSVCLSLYFYVRLCVCVYLKTRPSRDDGRLAPPLAFSILLFKYLISNIVITL